MIRFRWLMFETRTRVSMSNVPLICFLTETFFGFGTVEWPKEVGRFLFFTGFLSTGFTLGLVGFHGSQLALGSVYPVFFKILVLPGFSSHFTAHVTVRNVYRVLKKKKWIHGTPGVFVIFFRFSRVTVSFFWSLAGHQFLEPIFGFYWVFYRVFWNVFT